MTKKTKNYQVLIPPGREVFIGYMKENSKLFNLSEIERLCELPEGSIRHIRTRGPAAAEDLYKKIRSTLLPKLCEFVFALQNYDHL